jgi:MFS family permease
LLTLYVDATAPFFVFAWLMLFFITWYHGPMAAVVDDLVVDDRAATAQAGFIFTMHFFGTAPSSYAVGLLADHTSLRTALLAPTVALLLAALAFAGGWRHVAADMRAAAEAGP